jgi:hypothetical protein
LRAYLGADHIVHISATESIQERVDAVQLKRQPMSDGGNNLLKAGQ